MGRKGGGNIQMINNTSPSLSMIYFITSLKRHLLMYSIPKTTIARIKYYLDFDRLKIGSKFQLGYWPQSQIDTID